MTNPNFRRLGVILTTLLVSLGALFTITSCATNESKAKKAIEAYLKGQGITDITLDMFYTNPNSPDKAYSSATVTYNFASSRGTAQKEYLGFILAREDTGWRVQGPSYYTKEPQQAATYLAGGK